MLICEPPISNMASQRRNASRKVDLLSWYMFRTKMFIGHVFRFTILKKGFKYKCEK